MTGYRRRWLWIAIIAVTSVFAAGARRDGCTDARRIDWIGTTGRSTIFLQPARTDSVTVADPGVPGAMRFGQWYGDDHSELVLFEHDTRVLVSRSPILEWPFVVPDLAQGFTQIPWQPDAADGMFVSRLASGTLAPSEAARNVDIGYCSLTARWTSQAGTGLADLIAQGVIEEVQKRLPLGTPTATFVPVFRSRTNGVSADQFCMAFSDFVRDDLACTIEGVGFAFCGRFRVAPAPDDPTKLDVVFELLDAKTEVGRVSGACAEIGFDREDIERELQSALLGEPAHVECRGAPIVGGCGPVLVPGKPDIGERISDQLNECLWIRDKQRVFDYSDGAQPCQRIGTLPSPALACHRAPTPEERDAVCERRFPGVRSVCEQRGEGEDRDAQAFCYWNVEVDRVESTPVGLEIVLAHSRLEADGGIDETITAFDLAFEEAGIFETVACRGGAFAPSRRLEAGVVDWTPAVTTRSP